MNRDKFKSCSILVVDDDENIIHMFRRILRGRGFEMVEFCTAPEDALKKVITRPYSIVVSDYHMPEMNGIDFLEQVRKISPESIRIILTGRVEDAKIAREAINRAGVFRFLSKPLNVDDLVGVIEAAVDQHHFDSRENLSDPKRENAEPVSETGTSHLQELIDGSADATVIVDLSGHVCALNRQAEIILDRSLPEMIGEPFGFHGSPGEEREIVIYRSDGRTTIGHMKILTTEWEGNPAYMAVIRDITESSVAAELRIRIADEMRISRMKDDFVSMVSHELRTPLTIIGGVIYNLMAGCAGEMNPHQRKLCGIADRNVKRLSTLINDILDLSRYERGQVKPHRRRIDIDRILHNLVSEYHLSGRAGTIQIDVTVHVNQSHVFLDPDLFVQVMNNLLSNAIKHARSIVRIVVTESQNDEKIPDASAESDSVIHISVIDDGSGIPREKIPALFNKFTQITRKDDENGYKGTGLGLSISKKIVDLCGGVIWAESKSGDGSSFNVVLPNVLDDRMFDLFLQSTQQGCDMKGVNAALIFLKLDTAGLATDEIRSRVFLLLREFVDFIKPRLGISDLMVHYFEIPPVVLLGTWSGTGVVTEILEHVQDMLREFCLKQTDGDVLSGSLSVEYSVLIPEQESTASFAQDIHEKLEQQCAMMN